MKRKTLGILGGMGPEATADLFFKVVKATPAEKDQEHLRIIVDSIPQVPDRTAAILGRGQDPGPILAAAARRLESWGAELIVVPCNTAHHYYGAVAGAVDVPVLHIMREAARLIAADHPGVRNVGVLASTGTLNTGMYAASLAELGLDEVVPSTDSQELVMKAIYGVKAGDRAEPGRLLAAVAAEMVDRGAQAIIAGCTEVPIALAPGEVSVPYIDATLALARAAVRVAQGG